MSVEEQQQQPEPKLDIDAIRVKLTESLREQVRLAFPAMLATVLASGDLLFLAGMGVDWKQLVREVIEDETNNVLQDVG